MWYPATWLAFLSLLPIAIVGKDSVVKSTQVVCWLSTRKLTWADFQATAKPILPKKDILPGSFLGATTEAHAVVYDQLTNTGQSITVVSVQFDKRKSWVSTESFFDGRRYLPHEQLHFDIVELTGRKIRQVLVRYAAQHVSYHTPKTEAEIGCLYEEEYDLQLLYDKEAGGGNSTAQAWWQAYVRRELNKLSQFESTAKDCVAP